MLVARSGVFGTARPEGAGEHGEAACDVRSGVLTGRQEGAGDCGEAAAVFPRGRPEGAGDCGEVAQHVVFAPCWEGVCTGEACCLRFFTAASACKAVSSG